MAKKSIRTRIAEMIDTDTSNPVIRGLNTLASNSGWFGAQFKRGNLWEQVHIAENNFARSDYALMRAIYYNCIVDGVGREYLLAAALGKPIVNVIAGFVAGRGFTVELDNHSNDQNIQDAEDQINHWLDENMSDLYDFLRYGYRDGDSYLHIDELCNLTLLDPFGVEAILDPVTAKLRGFDVVDKVWIFVPGTDEKAKINRRTLPYYYLRRYRTDSIQIVQYQNETDLGNNQHGTVLYEKAYTADGAIDLGDLQVAGDPDVDLEAEQPNDTIYTGSDIIEQQLPILHFANEPDAKAVYGTSEYINVLAIFQNYAQILSGATKNVVYNSTPIPVIKGVRDTDAFEADATAEPDKWDFPRAPIDNNAAGAGLGLDWSNQKVLYIDGDNAGASFLQATGVATDAIALLEMYFYLMVQGSETPEFSLGTGVASSKASTDSQMPILLKKIERKQRQATKVLRKLIRVYMEKQTLLSNPTFLNIDIENIKIAVIYPDIDDEDQAVTLNTVAFALGNGLMTKQTALELIAGDKVKNVSDELKKAAKEVVANPSVTGAASDRLVNAIVNNKPVPSSGAPDSNPGTKTTPAKPAPAAKIDPSGGSPVGRPADL